MKKCRRCLRYYDENISRKCPYCEVTNPLKEELFPRKIAKEEKTRLYTPLETTSFEKEKKRESLDIAPKQDNETIVISNVSHDKLKIEPVVGWLVVVKGEGIGSDLRIVSGMNTLGRGTENKIVLNYGDNTISSSHATIVYDYRNNIFFFQHGGGTNLSYLNNSVVLQPKEIKSGDTIGIGNTELLFVPLCNENFNWNRP